jgi:hypothetical protein
LGIFEHDRISRFRRTATAGATGEASAMVSLKMFGLFIVLFFFLVLAFFDPSSCRLRSALAGSGVPWRNSFRAVHRGTPQDLPIRYAEIKKALEQRLLGWH